MRGFVVSWFYPPINSSESFVTYKLLSHSSLEYDVWTRSNNVEGVWDRDVEEKEFSSKNITVLDVYKGVNRKKWIDLATKYFIENHEKYDFIMTRSMPPEAHEVGRQIKKLFPEIKWIASFGDPLVGTPYLKIADEENPYLLRRYIEKENPSKVRAARILLSPMRNAQKYVWKKERRAMNLETDYEKINDYTLRGADGVILNNDYQLRHVFSGKYKKYLNKAIVVPHSFDESFFEGFNYEKGDKIRFVYAGHLDVLRNAGVLLRAINKLKGYNPALEELVEFNFYGHLSDKDKLFIIEHKLYDVVKINGDISYFDSLKKMKEADWLLCFDANFAKFVSENIYFPAKLADYIGSGRNLLAITQVEGVTADIVRGVGCGVVCSHSACEVAMYLSKIIYKGYTIGKIKESERIKYSSKYVAKEYDKRIIELMK